MTRPKFLTSAEVAERLRMTPMYVIRLCRDGKLPATKPAGTWLISEDDLDAHIHARSNRKAAS